MITAKNYYVVIEKINLTTLPKVLMDSHTLVCTITNDGKNWEHYHKNQIIKRVIDLYFERLNQMNMKTEKQTQKTRHSEEVKFIKRYVALDGKTATKKEIHDFIDALQKAISEKHIRKTSRYAKSIEGIQNELIRCHNLMTSPIVIKISKEKLEHLKKELKSEAAKPQCRGIGKIYNANGKLAPCKDVTYTDAVGKKGRCSYHKGVGEIFSHKPKKIKAKKLDKCHDKMYSSSYSSRGRCSYHRGSTSSLRGIDEKKKDELFTDLNHIKSKDTFKLNGELGKFLGDLERYQLAITLEGDQGSGKSQMAFQLANAFADKQFKVGLFSLEMGADSSLISRNRDKYIDAKNRDRILITGQAPEGILTVRTHANDFDTIVIDSWNKLDVDSNEFDKLRKDFPNTIWIVIFQRTTAGTIRGGTRPLYDAGINIEVVKVDNTFENNYAIASKNRYGVTGIQFNISKQTVID
jgi:hypothetical protein